MESSNLSLFCAETVCYLLAGGTTHKEIAAREANIVPTYFELRGKMYGPKHQWQVNNQDIVKSVFPFSPPLL